MHDRNPELVAHIAATLLQGRGEAEPHQVKAAVSTAHAILDETYGRPEQPEPVAAEPETTMTAIDGDGQGGSEGEQVQSN